MDEMHQITLEEWLSWKEDIRRKLSEAASNFVYIGFRLKQIRDSGMLDGAADIFEFALKEYGLGKSTTSRFIAINEKFSEGGNSLELRQEFKSISSSKLADMLTLTDSECRLITEKTTVKEIRALKKFSRQQAPDGESDGQHLSPLQKCLIDFFRGKKELLNAVITAVSEERYRDAEELINPSGHCSHKKGICFLFMEDYNTGVKAKLLTDPAPLEMSWQEMLREVYAIYADIYENGEEDVYGAYYDNAVKPDKVRPESLVREEDGSLGTQEAGGSVATSQQDEKETDPEAAGNAGNGEKDNASVNPPEAAEEAAQTKTRAAAAQKPSSQEPEYVPLPGQMEITDYPNVMPEPHYEEIPLQEPGQEETVKGETADGQETGDGKGAEGLERAAVEIARQAQDPEYVDSAVDANAGNTGSGLIEGELAWINITRFLRDLSQWSAIWDYETVPGDILARAYRTAIDVAAAIEKVMNMKGVKNG